MHIKFFFCLPILECYARGIFAYFSFNAHQALVFGRARPLFCGSIFMGHRVQKSVERLYSVLAIFLEEIFFSRKHYVVLMAFEVESSFVTHLFQQQQSRSRQEKIAIRNNSRMTRSIWQQRWHRGRFLCFLGNFFYEMVSANYTALVAH